PHRARQTHNCGPDSNNAGVTPLLCADDANPCTSYERTTKCGNCPSPVAVHPVAEKIKIQADERAQQRPAPGEPPLQRPAQCCGQHTCTQPHTEPGMPEE